MKRLFIVSLAAVLMSTATVLASTVGAAAAPGSRTIVNLRGPLINASFSDTDPTGCITTDVFVSSNSGIEQDLPHTDHFGVASVSIYRYNSCTGATLLDASGLNDSLAAGQLSVSQQLDRASLNTEITVSDLVTGSSFPVRVDVALTGTGEIVRDHSNTNEIYPGCHIINRWKGSGRDAVATGTVTDGSTNFTPGPSNDAEIGLVISGFEIIGCS